MPPLQGLRGDPDAEDHPLRTRPAQRPAAPAAVLLCLLAPAAQADSTAGPAALPLAAVPTALTQTRTATFRGAGGDLTYGAGDNSVVTLVTGVMPLFDMALGTLERVTIDFSGWRSLDFTCTQGLDGGAFGQGGAAGITSMQWDGDATVNLSDHYVSAVPEPETWALWLAGLGALGQVARRRNGRG